MHTPTGTGSACCGQRVASARAVGGRGRGRGSPWSGVLESASAVSVGRALERRAALIKSQKCAMNGVVHESKYLSGPLAPTKLYYVLCDLSPPVPEASFPRLQYMLQPYS